MKYLILFLLCAQAYAGDDDHEGPKVGEGKAVISYDRATGFQLSQDALLRMGVHTLAIDPKKCNLKLAQTISALDRKEIFIFRGGKFKSFEVSCSEVRAGDEVVDRGAESLRVVEMDHESAEEGGNRD